MRGAASPASAGLASTSRSMRVVSVTAARTAVSSTFCLWLFQAKAPAMAPTTTTAAATPISASLRPSSFLGSCACCSSASSMGREHSAIALRIAP